MSCRKTTTSKSNACVIINAAFVPTVVLQPETHTYFSLCVCVCSSDIDVLNAAL